MTVHNKGQYFNKASSSPAYSTVTLLAVNMPGLSGIEALPQIREKSPSTKVLILSGFPEDEFMSQALQLGAKGYLSKLLSHKDLGKAIRTTYAGEIWAGRKVMAEALEGLRWKTQKENSSLLEVQENLTEREQEVTKWIIHGMTNKEIAAQLGISRLTVKTHVGHILSKLKIDRQYQLTRCQIVEQLG